MQMIVYTIVYGLSILRLSLNEIIVDKYFWQESNEWSLCSVTCGEGQQIKTEYCASMNSHSEVVKTTPDKCSHLQKSKRYTRICINHYCIEKYSWNTSAWSECSHSCGNLGFKYRVIECNQFISDTHVVRVEQGMCTKSTRPLQRSICNRNDCLPEFVSGQWGKCVRAPECQPGSQRRKLKCSQILKTGEIKPLSLYRCYLRGKPAPPQWRKCYEFVNVLQCLKEIPPKKVEFTVLNNSVYQMRRTSSLNLQIGQVGYLLPFSKIFLSCPVNNFPQYSVIWKHRNTTVVYSGKVSKRIKVNLFGKLKIQKLLFQDQGEWICVAGKSEKSIIIKIRNPSAGFQDWAIRTNVWKTGMLSEDSQQPFTRHGLNEWIKSEWSICSVTCFGEGFQFREIHCENLQPAFYTVLEDADCLKTSSLPNKRRRCYNSMDCPRWKMELQDQSKCSNECMDIGLGIQQVELRCIYLNQEVSMHMCEDRKKPPVSCKNDACQLDWRSSSWSRCSKSCGGIGFQARYIVCVWKISRKSAGSLCFENKFPIPNVLRKCETKPCVMGCVDFSSQCLANEKRCNHNLYRYLCCSACQKMFKITKLNKTN